MWKLLPSSRKYTREEEEILDELVQNLTKHKDETWEKLQDVFNTNTHIQPE